MISLTSPVETAAHGWPAGLKLGLLCVATVLLFAIDAPWLLALCCGLVLVVYALPGRRFFRAGAARLVALWPFVVLIVLWHVLTEEAAQGLSISLRLVAAVGLANLVTMTTRLSDMMALVERLAAPLAPLGLPPARMALAMALTVRFVPVLIQKGQLLRLSWRARSRRRAGWRIVLPFAVLAIDDAERVADALRARGGG